jgi:hypothetical protein
MAKKITHTWVCDLCDVNVIGNADKPSGWSCVSWRVEYGVSNAGVIDVCERCLHPFCKEAPDTFKKKLVKMVFCK